MSSIPPIDSFLGDAWSYEDMIIRPSRETSPGPSTYDRRAEDVGVPAQMYALSSDPSSATTRYSSASGIWSQDMFSVTPSTVRDYAWPSPTPAGVAAGGVHNIEDEITALMRPQSERGMPSSREALYWAIRTQCTVLGVRPSEEVFAFVVNLLIESSIAALDPGLLQGAPVPVRAIEPAPLPAVPGPSSEDTTAQGNAGFVRCCFGGGCGTVFSVNETAAAIKRHVHDVHRVDRSTASLKCTWQEPGGRQCSTEVRGCGMGKHLREVHIRAAAVVCKDCGKTLSRKDAEGRHRKTCKAKARAELLDRALTEDRKGA